MEKFITAFWNVSQLLDFKLKHSLKHCCEMCCNSLTLSPGCLHLWLQRHLQALHLLIWSDLARKRHVFELCLEHIHLCWSKAVIFLTAPLKNQHCSCAITSETVFVFLRRQDEPVPAKAPPSYPEPFACIHGVAWHLTCERCLKILIASTTAGLESHLQPAVSLELERTLD